jgi:glucokinase
MSIGQPEQEHWLVADIGGTNARVGLYRPGQSGPSLLFARPTTDFMDLAALLRAAIQTCPEARVRNAVCAVASPVEGDEVVLTNAGWRFSTETTRQQCGLDRLELINDWVAQGWAITRLGDDQLERRGGGDPVAAAPLLALGPGTGLGSALVIPTRNDWRVFATEGGHISFGPVNHREVQVMMQVIEQFGHCSAERLASGLGLETIDAALAAIDRRRGRSRDARAIVADVRAGDPLAEETLAIFTQALASAAGDLTLATGTRGGVYLSGGLIPALGRLFDWQAFYRRFVAKGRFRDYLAAVPIFSVEAEQPALTGLAAYVERRR